MAQQLEHLVIFLSCHFLNLQEKPLGALCCLPPFLSSASLPPATRDALQRTERLPDGLIPHRIPTDSLITWNSQQELGLVVWSIVKGLMCLHMHVPRFNPRPYRKLSVPEHACDLNLHRQRKVDEKSRSMLAR